MKKEEANLQFIVAVNRAISYSTFVENTEGLQLSSLVCSLLAVLLNLGASIKKPFGSIHRRRRLIVVLLSPLSVIVPTCTAPSHAQSDFRCGAYAGFGWASTVPELCFGS